MEYRNAKMNKFGTVDCEVNHPDFGWIPFTATPNDVHEYGREIFSKAKRNAAPYVVDPQEEAARVAEEQAREAERQRKEAALSNLATSLGISQEDLKDAIKAALE